MTMGGQLKFFEGGIPTPGYNTDAGYDLNTITSLIQQGFAIPGNILPGTAAPSITDTSGTRLAATTAMDTLENGQSLTITTADGARHTVADAADLATLFASQQQPSQ
ncbi:MAG: hypothetical protein ACYCW6_25105, partial [Candidatus Xenobia bacterium]